MTNKTAATKGIPQHNKWGRELSVYRVLTLITFAKLTLSIKLQGAQVTAGTMTSSINSASGLIAKEVEDNLQCRYGFRSHFNNTKK